VTFLWTQTEKKILFVELLFYLTLLLVGKMKFFLYLLVILTTILVFFIARHIGIERSFSDSCSLLQEISPSASQLSFMKNTPKERSCIPKKRTTKKKTQSFSLCADYSNLSVSYFVKGDSTVPEEAFAYLHHPASPAKSSFFLINHHQPYRNLPSYWKNTNSKKKRKVKDLVTSSHCSEVYLTRTGSRGNQPNKCISVVVVPGGFPSINQQSHRKGYTALNTDQYQQDYPRDYGKVSRRFCFLLFVFLLHFSFNSILGKK
jgi:hypothetical protein